MINKFADEEVLLLMALPEHTPRSPTALLLRITD